MILYKTEEEAMANGLKDYGYQTEFEGKNCHDFDDSDCAGWDGESRRCDCGNRRVYWEPYDNDDGTFYVIATAW